MISSFLFFILYGILCNSVYAALKAEILPNTLETFRVGQIRELSIIIYERVETNHSSLIDESPEVICRDNSVCEVTSLESVYTEYENKTMIHIYNITIEAIFLGITQLDITFDNLTISTDPYIIRVMRATFYVHISTIFTAVIATFITIVTFMMGTQLEWSRIRDVIRRPIGPIIGFVCQFILMPLFSFFIAEYAFNDDEIVLKLALFAASTCPGGGKSSFWTIIFGGNLDLSVAMTFTQTIAAIFMMPLWLYTLGRRFTSKRIDIPFFAIIQGLIFLMIPSGAGMYFIHRKPHLVKRIEGQIKKCTWFATIFFTAFGVWANWYVFLLVSWKTIIVGCLMPWAGYLIAYTTAWMCGQSPQNKITIAIETGVQNIGIATILMIWSLPEPEVDMSLTMFFVIMLSTDKPLIILWLIRKCHQKFKVEKDPSVIGKYTVNAENVEVADARAQVNKAYESMDERSQQKEAAH